MAVIHPKNIAVRMKTIKGWKYSGNKIIRVFIKKDFVQALNFVQSVAFLAEKMNHHPDITIRWNTVTLVLSTHSEGGVTEKDFELAANINKLQK